MTAWIALTVIVSSCSNSKTVSAETEDKIDKVPPKAKPIDDYVDGGAIRYADHTYEEDIRTVQLYATGDPLSYPIILLDGLQRLELHFDDLGQDLEQYYYRIYHCDSEWNRSDIIEMQYIEGFFSDLVDDYDMSFNTLVPYVHYSTTFPNESMRLTVSGNYVVVVTRDDDESQPILSKRFMVVEPLVVVEADVRQSLIADVRRYKQLINFNVHHPTFPLNNPFRDIKAVILQNWRWDRAITDLKPIFLRDQMLEYRYDRGNDFWAGNEFRQFNISSTRYVSEQVVSVQREGDRFVAQLSRDYKRSLQGYRTFEDINGRYLVRNTEGFHDITESDYVDTRFILDWPTAQNNGSFYIFGALSNWGINPDFKLRYDYDLEGYTCEVPLKQGFYEYEYVFLADKSDAIDELPIEGSYFETENDYTVLIYYQDIGVDFDRLIGMTTFSTRNRF